MVFLFAGLLDANIGLNNIICRCE